MFNVIKEIEPGLFLFQFFHLVDVQRVMEGGPWTYDNILLIFHKLLPGDVPSQVPFFNVDFWVQVYDLSAGFMRRFIGKQLGNFVGSFVEYDEKNNSNLWRSYMRVRVKLDVRVPLKRWKKITCLGVVSEGWGAWLRAPNRCFRILRGDCWLKEDDDCEDKEAAKAKLTVCLTGDHNGKAIMEAAVPSNVSHNMPMIIVAMDVINGSTTEEDELLLAEDRKRKRIGPVGGVSQSKLMEVDCNELIRADISTTESQINLATIGEACPSNVSTNEIVVASPGSQACQEP
ncbi:hypothetical protein PTKIN_Ptkin06aG0165400 [Pterospermum kingtungense]